jgi:DNA-binding PadR family transcriptional regulator
VQADLHACTLLTIVVEVPCLAFHSRSLAGSLGPPWTGGQEDAIKICRNLAYHVYTGYSRQHTQYNTDRGKAYGRAFHQFRGGDTNVSVRHAMLALLSEGPKYGLQLREEFEARTGEVWPLNVGQVYTTLQRLERDGLVESDDAEGSQPPPEGATPRTPREKGFRITQRGLRELQTWLRTPPDLSSPPRDELVMKVLVALRVPGASVPEIIQAHRRYLVELMQQWTHIKEEADPADLNLGLAVDAEIFRLDSVVRWLDAADVRIKRTAADSAAENKAAEDKAAAANDSSPPGAGNPAPERWPLPRYRRLATREVRTRR